jgi:hypothetical protein
LAPWRAPGSPGQPRDKSLLGRVLSFRGLTLAGTGFDSRRPHHFPLPIVYLSRYIIAHKPDYYRLLFDVTPQSNAAGWDPWLRFMFRGVEDTAAPTRARIAVIRTLAAET